MFCETKIIKILVLHGINLTKLAAIAFIVLFLNPRPVIGQAFDPDTIDKLLSNIPIGSAWQDINEDLRIELEKRALLLLDVDRQAWGLSGLQKKEKILLSAPTPAMEDNINNVLSLIYASELPGGFHMARDISNADLKQMLIRIYLAFTDDRGFMLYNHPEFNGWDGKPVTELYLLDHEHVRAVAIWLRETEANLRKLSDDKLNPLEKALRSKSYFTTRAGKYFDKPAVSGSIGYAKFYSFEKATRPFSSDVALLDAYNASMFTTFRDVNVGTLDAFNFGYEPEFDRASLKSQGMSDALADNIIKLANLFRTRVQALPEKSKRCTILTSAERDAIWDAFTAGQISNADGSETIQSYAALYKGIAAQRVATTQAVARMALERMFPDGSGEISAEQRRRVTERLLREMQPAKMMDTLIAALDEVTGATVASAKIKDAIEKQPKVGGQYAPGQPVRDADKIQILGMWKNIRDFIKREYSGYRVDIARLIPEEPIIITTGQNQNSQGGQVTLALGAKWNLASFASTFMHEIKHAIDQRSRAAVEGAAWEGAATSIERQVWPIFIEEAMAAQASLLPIARLTTEIDNVRFTATTDATLKILMRETCGDNEPDTIAYAKETVRSYGYDDQAFLQLRSRRAHRSSQYLEYDYGLAMYSDVLSYLQNGIGSTPRVDAYLLQACGLPSPKKNQTTLDDLKACIRDRRQ